MGNGPDRFGWLSRGLHWVMAAGILGMLALGVYIDNMTVSLSNLWLFGLHKSVGVTLLLLWLVRVVWHRLSGPPAPLTAGTPQGQQAAARWAHRGLYALMVLVPLSGWIGSGASGLGVVVFGRITLPPLAPVSKQWEALAFGLHGALTKLLFVVILLHVAAALHRHLIKRDRTLQRMWRGG